jgi:nucleotide-binding universal stress UspA family protein
MTKVITFNEQTQLKISDKLIALRKKYLMKRILIPSDFSPNAQNATDYGISLFDSEDVSFVLLNTFYIPYASSEVSYSYDSASRENAKQLFDKEIKRITKHFPDLKAKLETHFEIGDIASVIPPFIQREEIDYLVMGTKGASGLSEVLVGSRTASVIKKVDCPMIIVPENARFSPPKNILFTTDKELQNKTLNIDLLIEIAKKYNSSIHGLYVSKTGENMDVEARFINYDLNLRLVDLKHDLNVSVNEDPIKSIEQYTLKYPVDLLAMVSLKGNLFYRLFHKSVTKKIAMHTDTPMLIMHS